MKLAVAKTNYPHTMPSVFLTLDGAIKHYQEDGFEVVAYLNTQPDLTPGGAKMRNHHPLMESEEITISLVDVNAK